MSRWLSWLAELQPEMFCEISPELAARGGAPERRAGPRSGTARGEIECRVLVTPRLTPLRHPGAHGPRRSGCRTTGATWGACGAIRRTSSSRSSPTRTSQIQESKALTGSIVRAGRSSRGRRSATDGLSLRQPEPCRTSPATVPGSRSAAARTPTRTGGDPWTATRRASTWGRARRALRLLHRHHPLHRLQGLRGRLQAVEPAPRRRLRLHRDELRQHRPPRAPRPGGTSPSSSARRRCPGREVRATAPPPRRGRSGSSSRWASPARPRSYRDIAPSHVETPVPLGPTQQALGKFSWLMMSDVCKHCEHAGCLEACPTGRHHPHRVRLGLHPAGRLQRLRLLRGGLPVRRHRPARGRRPRLEVHPLLRPPKGGLEPACAKACPTGVDPVRRARRAARAGRGARRAAARARRRRGVSLRRGRGEPARHGGAARLLPAAATSPRSTTCRPTRWCRRRRSSGAGGRWPPECCRSRRSRPGRRSLRGAHEERLGGSHLRRGAVA